MFLINAIQYAVNTVSEVYYGKKTFDQELVKERIYLGHQQLEDIRDQTIFIEDSICSLKESIAEIDLNIEAAKDSIEKNSLSSFYKIRGEIEEEGFENGSKIEDEKVDIGQLKGLINEWNDEKSKLITQKMSREANLQRLISSRGHIEALIDEYRALLLDTDSSTSSTSSNTITEST